jgi:hypothetical protein
VFAQTHVQKFCRAFSKARGVWGNAPYTSVFFLIAFSFAHLSSKEKAGKEFALAKRL